MNQNQFGNESNDWRATLADINPAMARLPASQIGATLLETHGKHDAAVRLYQDLLVHSPENLRLLGSIVKLLFKLNRLDEALAYRRQACEIEVVERGVPVESREEVVQYLLAKEGLIDEPAQAPSGYVSNLFDNYADSFEQDLVKTLQYRGPEEAYQTVSGLSDFQFSEIEVLDLGCGTGLAGEVFRPHAKRLVGVDLSAKMVEHAKAKQIYDKLVVGDIVEAMDSMSAQYDLIVAADVFVYVGDLCQAILSCFQSLVPLGALVFSVEEGLELDGRGYTLCGSGRYKHSRQYVSQQLSDAGFESVDFREVVLRNENGKPVNSLMCSTRR